MSSSSGEGSQPREGPEEPSQRRCPTPLAVLPKRGTENITPRPLPQVAPAVVAVKTSFKDRIRINNRFSSTLQAAAAATAPSRRVSVTDAPPQPQPGCSVPMGSCLPTFHSHCGAVDDALTGATAGGIGGKDDLPPGSQCLISSGSEKKHEDTVLAAENASASPPKLQRTETPTQFHCVRGKASDSPQKVEPSSAPIPLTVPVCTASLARISSAHAGRGLECEEPEQRCADAISGIATSGGLGHGSFPRQPPAAPTVAIKSTPSEDSPQPVPLARQRIGAGVQLSMDQLTCTSSIPVPEGDGAHPSNSPVRTSGTTTTASGTLAVAAAAAIVGGSPSTVSPATCFTPTSLTTTWSIGPNAAEQRRQQRGKMLRRNNSISAASGVSSAGALAGPDDVMINVVSQTELGADTALGSNRSPESFAVGSYGSGPTLGAQPNPLGLIGLFSSSVGSASAAFHSTGAQLGCSTTATGLTSPTFHERGASASLSVTGASLWLGGSYAGPSKDMRKTSSFSSLYFSMSKRGHAPVTPGGLPNVASVPVSAPTAEVSTGTGADPSESGPFGAGTYSSLVLGAELGLEGSDSMLIAVSAMGVEDDDGLLPDSAREENGDSELNELQLLEELRRYLERTCVGVRETHEYVLMPKYEVLAGGRTAQEALVNQIRWKVMSSPDVGHARPALSSDGCRHTCVADYPLDTLAVSSCSPLYSTASPLTTSPPATRLGMRTLPGSPSVGHSATAPTVPLECSEGLAAALRMSPLGPFNLEGSKRVPVNAFEVTEGVDDCFTMGTVATAYAVDPATEDPTVDCKTAARLRFLPDKQGIVVLRAQEEVGRYLRGEKKSGIGNDGIAATAATDFARAEDDEGSGGCACSEEMIIKDMRGTDYSMYNAQTLFHHCSTCYRRPAAFLCLHCLRSFCPSHVECHHRAAPDTCTLFLNVLDIVTNYHRVFWCERCRQFTWLYTSVYDPLVDQIFDTLGTYLNDPVRDIHCVGYSVQLRSHGPLDADELAHFSPNLVGLRMSPTLAMPPPLTDPEGHVPGRQCATPTQSAAPGPADGAPSSYIGSPGSHVLQRDVDGLSKVEAVRVGRAVSKLAALGASVQGWRATQEDAEAAFLIEIPSLLGDVGGGTGGRPKPNPPQKTADSAAPQDDAATNDTEREESIAMAVYCVFDGHGGDAVAKIAAASFEQHLRAAIERTHPDDVRARALLFQIDNESTQTATMQCGGGARGSKPASSERAASPVGDNHHSPDSRSVISEENLERHRRLSSLPGSDVDGSGSPHSPAHGFRRRDVRNSASSAQMSPELSVTIPPQLVQSTAADAAPGPVAHSHMTFCQPFRAPDATRRGVESWRATPPRAASPLAAYTTPQLASQQQPLPCRIAGSEEDVLQRMSALVSVKEMEMLRCYFASVMEEALLSLDAAISQLPEGRRDYGEVGCTACVVGITTNFILCANVGDSGAAFYTNESIQMISTTHRITDEVERRRIIDAGYTIDGGRIQGMLAVTRALGDYDFKQCGGKSPREQAVIAVPDVTIMAVPSSPQEGIIERWGVLVACDGVWDTATLRQIHHAIINTPNDLDVAGTATEAVLVARDMEREMVREERRRARELRNEVRRARHSRQQKRTTQLEQAIRLLATADGTAESAGEGAAFLPAPIVVTRSPVKVSESSHDAPGHPPSHFSPLGAADHTSPPPLTQLGTTLRPGEVGSQPSDAVATAERAVGEGDGMRRSRSVSGSGRGSAPLSHHVSDKPRSAPRDTSQVTSSVATDSGKGGGSDGDEDGGVDPMLLTSAAGIFAQCVAPEDNEEGIGLDNVSLILIEVRH